MLDAKSKNNNLKVQRQHNEEETTDQSQRECPHPKKHLKITV